MQFQYRVEGVDDARQRINDALYFIRILRNYLLTNAQVLGLGYEGIRVLGWSLEDGLPQDRFAVIESDDQWRKGNLQRHESRLVRPVELGEADYQALGFDPPPDWAFMAQESPPAELPPRPPPRPEPTTGRRISRAPKSALDESDEENG